MSNKHGKISYSYSSFIKNYLHAYKRKIGTIITIVFVLNVFFLIAPVQASEKKSLEIQTGTEASATGEVDRILNEIRDSFNNLFHKDVNSSDKNIENKENPPEPNNEDTKIDFEKRLNEVLNDKKRIDTGEGFVKEIINNNDRMKFYDLYIKLAKAKGYIITSYIDYLENYKDTDKKVLILRHDIDEKSDGTKMMFDIEKKNDVKATYYFRWKTFDLDLIKEISSAGFEVGLHYETIATYCIDNHTRKIGQEEIDKCREILKKEIKDFKLKTGIDIKTISSHGNPINREINIPNNVLLLGQKYSDYGIVSETYDPNIIKNYVKSYICDNDLMKKYGFAYRANPIDSILQNDKVIEFLSHPSHWYYTVYQRAKMYLEVQNSSHKAKV